MNFIWNDFEKTRIKPTQKQRSQKFTFDNINSNALKVQILLNYFRGDHIVPNFEEIWPSGRNKGVKGYSGPEKGPQVTIFQPFFKSTVRQKARPFFRLNYS